LILDAQEGDHRAADGDRAAGRAGDLHRRRSVYGKY